MATALRPRLSPNSIASREDSQALALGLRCGEATDADETAPTSSGGRGLRSVITSESIITSLAGFAVVFAVAGAVEKWETPEAKAEAFSKAASSPSFPRLASANSFTAVAAFSAPKSVIFSLAGFAARRPHPPGERTAIPAAFRYWLAVSRRMRVARWICRSGHPSRPRAKTCCFFSSVKTLAMSSEATEPPRASMSQTPFSLAGFQVITIGRFWVIAEDQTPEATTPYRPYQHHRPPKSSRRLAL